MNRAITVISFGTTVPEAMTAIENIEQTLSIHFKLPVFRAFTSRIVRERLVRRDGTEIPPPKELFTRLISEGFSDIICIPTHIIPGIEYEKLLADAADFPSVRVSHPLLWSEQSYDACVHAVMSSIPVRTEKEALILMGHGTPHFSNAAYSQLQSKFRTEGYSNVFVGTVEGYPRLEHILHDLEAAEIKKALLLPFLIVAGDHARNDLYGDEPDSWKSILHTHGIQTRAVLKGLGEFPLIAELFVHICREMTE